MNQYDKTFREHFEAIFGPLEVQRQQLERRQVPQHAIVSTPLGDRELIYKTRTKTLPNGEQIQVQYLDTRSDEQ